MGMFVLSILFSGILLHFFPGNEKLIQAESYLQSFFIEETVNIEIPASIPDCPKLKCRWNVQDWCAGNSAGKDWCAGKETADQNKDNQRVYTCTLNTCEEEMENDILSIFTLQEGKLLLPKKAYDDSNECKNSQYSEKCVIIENNSMEPYKYLQTEPWFYKGQALQEDEEATVLNLYNISQLKKDFPTYSPESPNRYKPSYKTLISELVEYFYERQAESEDTKLHRTQKWKEELRKRLVSV
tara:strand:+ start:659 stop:1381 length:723 start_codon:yes stop_codon:yes gene_type:complete